ncbi:EDSAP-1 family PEP-CTERM protein, partial [Sulfurirhabdus autotrophica]
MENIKFLSKRRLALVSMLAAYVGLSANAQASAYAVSTNTISNFGMTFSPTSSFSAFTFSSDAATLGSTGNGNAATMNAPAVCIGCSYSDSYFSHGMSATEYSYGDARITNANVLLGSGGASTIGESSINNGTGSGYGNNTMVGFFSISAPTSIGINFDATPFLLTQLAAGGLASTANISTTVTIRDSNNVTVFSWAPNGKLDGSETADTYDLNWGIGQGGSFTGSAGHFSNSVTLNNSGFYT